MTLESLSGSNLLHAAGWALIHSLWQCTIVAIVAATVLGWMRERLTTDKRHVALCLALLMMAILPIGTCVWFMAGVSPQEQALPPVSLSGLASVRANVALQGSFWQSAISTLDRVAPWLSMVWLVGAVSFLARMAAGCVYAQRLKTRGAVNPPAEWAERFRRLSNRLGVKRCAALKSSLVAEVPCVVGWLKPVVLAPAAAFSGMDRDQLESLLAHELAHVRRNDYLVGIVQGILESLFFYHPAVWWVSDRVRMEREQCCDDLAVQACGNVALYVRALTELEEWRHSSNPALAASGARLLPRIRRLAGVPHNQTFGASLPVVTSCLLIVVFSAYTLAQSGGNSQAQERKPGVAQETAPPSDAALIRFFDESTDVKDKLEAVSRLSGSVTAAAWSKLVAIAERDPDVRVRKEAIGYIAGRANEQAVRELIRLYDASSDRQIKLHLLSYISGLDTPQTKEKIRAVVRTEKDHEVRMKALDYMLGR